MIHRKIKIFEYWLTSLGSQEALKFSVFPLAFLALSSLSSLCLPPSVLLPARSRSFPSLSRLFCCCSIVVLATGLERTEKRKDWPFSFPLHSILEETGVWKAESWYVLTLAMWPWNICFPYLFIHLQTEGFNLECILKIPSSSDRILGWFDKNGVFNIANRLFLTLIENLSYFIVPGMW